MRIAIISTSYKATPPAGYGGIERVVHALAEQLVKDGHDIILFGASGSHCSGRTIEISTYDPSKAPSGVWKISDVISEEPLYDAVSEYLKNQTVDVIHDWSFQNLFVLRHPRRFPFVISTCVPPGPGYKRPNLVASSKAHARLFEEPARFVHYGLDLEKWGYNYSKEDHFIHISKIARYKGQHLAIKASRKTGAKLVLAGNIEDRLYYYSVIKPLLWISPAVKYIGEIQGTHHHLQKASALIQTPRWFDAFPLVILEALASGTPVISFSEGGVPEQIVHGVTGFLCNTTNDLVFAIRNINRINPRYCRAYAEEHFSVQRMASDYIALYQEVIDGNKW